jgi:hypothetical protein
MTGFVVFAPKRSFPTLPNFQVSCRNCALRCNNTSKESEHWPFGNWPGKSHVETNHENDNRERLRELAAKIAAEQDHDKFTALVQEFNQLLDEEKQQPNEPRKSQP